MEKLLIGKIINTRGLKGEVKVNNYSSFLKQRYKVGNEVFLSNDEVNFVTKKITHVSVNNGFVYLSFEGINDIDMANAYRDYNIYCSSDELNESGDVYHFLTLKDMDVVYNDKVIGKVSDIESNGVQDLIRVSIGNKSILIPFMDHFVVEVDVKNKKMVVDNLGGLYED